MAVCGLIGYMREQQRVQRSLKSLEAAAKSEGRLSSRRGQKSALVAHDRSEGG